MNIADLIRRNGREWTAEEKASHARLVRALDNARADVARKFPVITPENFKEVNAYQETRIKFWKGATQC